MQAAIDRVLETYGLMVNLTARRGASHAAKT